MLSSFKRPPRSCSISRTQRRAGKSSTRRRTSGPLSRWSLCGIMAMWIVWSGILPFPHQRSAVPRARSGCVPTPKTRAATSSRRRRGAGAGSASNQATPRGLARIWWAPHRGPESSHGSSCPWSCCVSDSACFHVLTLVSSCFGRSTLVVCLVFFCGRSTLVFGGTLVTLGRVFLIRHLRS